MDMETLVTLVLSNNASELEKFAKDNTQFPDWSVLRSKEIDMMQRMAKWPVIHILLQKNWVPIQEVLQFASYYEWNESILEGLQRQQPNDFATIALRVEEYRFYLMSEEKIIDK